MNTTTNTSHESALPIRRYDIDWLRVIAVLLLFPYHIARIFNLDEEFYVKSATLSKGLTYFVEYLGPWHMPLLFFLAGASTWFALSHRDGRHYAGERFKRLFVPFLFGLVLLIPPQSYLGLLSHGGDPGSFFNWLPNFFHLSEVDPDGYFMGGLTFGHLWFIIHLFFYSLIALPIVLFLRRGAGRRLVGLLAVAATKPARHTALRGCPSAGLVRSRDRRWQPSLLRHHLPSRLSADGRCPFRPRCGPAQAGRPHPGPGVVPARRLLRRERRSRLERLGAGHPRPSTPRSSPPGSAWSPSWDMAGACSGRMVGCSGTSPPPPIPSTSSTRP